MTILNRIKVSALTLSILAGLCPTAINAQNPSLTVFAAASMKNALDEVNAAFTGDTGIKVTASYAASSVLIKQIQQGAPADIFVSADLDWMDFGSQKKLIKEETRLNLLGNRLVLVAPSDSNLADVAIAPGFDLAGLAGDGRVATGDVSTVPVGKYAKTALQKLGSWPAVSSRMAMTESVRAALMLVARGEAPLGIVYETDARVEPRAKVIGVFPKDSHPPVTYPVAATVTATPDAALYLDFLRSGASKALFEKYGFTFLVTEQGRIELDNDVQAEFFEQKFGDSLDLVGRAAVKRLQGQRIRDAG
jgi:molybdate transport system substrate-binding protein